MTKTEILQRTFIHSVSVKRMIVFDAGHIFKEFISKRYAFLDHLLILFLQRYVLFKYAVSSVSILVK